MKLSAFTLLIGLLFLISCRKKEEPLPECIQSKIDVFSGNSCEHGAKVEQYIFQGQTVFVFVMGFCGGDLPVHVLDENCKYVGMLGGFGGNTKINGEEFSTAKFIRTVWSR